PLFLVDRLAEEVELDRHIVRSLRKIWKSGGCASGKLRKCISILFFWMRPRTAPASWARKAMWSTDPEPVVPRGCFFNKKESLILFGACDARCTQISPFAFSQ